MKQQDLNLWREQLRNPNFNEEEVKILNNEINNKINRINKDISKFKNDSLMNKKIEFIPIKLDNYFGKINLEAL